MKQWTFGARLNSFRALPQVYEGYNGTSLETKDLLARAASVRGLNSVDLNYPEHFVKDNAATLARSLKELGLGCNGVATRFGESFVKGDFSNPNSTLRGNALQLAHEAAEMCQEIGGDTLTLWFAHDGYDYPFEGDHLERYRKAVDGVREIAEAHPEVRVSIEYKPYQPRAFSTFADIGMCLLAIRDIGAPNVGVTLDYCHMLMKRENPSQSLAMAVKDNRLFGVHLNDGYGDNDDGMMVGSVNLAALIEFIYYLVKYEYTGLIYFDTFPDRIDPVAECQANVDTVVAVHDFIMAWGLEKVSSLITEQNPVQAQKFIIELLRSSTQG